MNCMYTIYLHNFNQYNKRQGWSEGDKLLKSFAEILDNINESDFVFRIYGDDFIILNKEHFELKESIESLEKVLIGTGITTTYEHFDMKADSIYDIKDLEKKL